MGPRNGLRRLLRLALGTAVLVLVIGNAGIASAQDSTRKAMAMREKVYEKLSRAQEAAEAENWEKAFDYLDDVEKMKDLDPNEKAQLYTAYGYTYFAQENYAESIGAYERVLLQENLPEALRTSTLYTLGQLHFHLEHYEKAAGHLENWLTVAANPGPQPYVLLGQAYYQLGRPRDAVESIRQAVAAAEQRGQPVQENWYALLRVIYFELGEYENLLEVLEILVTRFPAKEYWVHLSSAYGEMGDTVRQLAAYEMAYAQGYLETGPEIVLLCQLLLQAEVPYRAGGLLDQALSAGVVEGTAANWRLLSQAWILAQEHSAAIEALTKAAELSDDGELNARIAQSYANLGDWEKSVEAAREALDKGVDNPQELQILQGMALFELGRFDEARTAFSAAQRLPKGRDTATRWLVYVESEKRRLVELGLQPE
ncbi:MAG: tetratricopeptide repeat protein [Candidatus Krumholzibacteriota bacterium]